MGSDAREGALLNEHIYEDIIVAGLDGWTPGSLVQACAGGASLRAQDLSAQRFLATCCLVSRAWAAIARRLLYRTVRLGPHDKHALHLGGSSDAATITRYLVLKTEDTLSSSKRLAEVSNLINLRSLIIREDVLITSLKPGLLQLRAHPSPHLVHLLYQGGNSILLGQLLSVLPQLQSLHVGRFNYSSTQSEQPPSELQTVCRLKELTFQSVYHYGASHLHWLFGSSQHSIESLTVANFGSLLFDLAPLLHKARSLSITIKNNLFSVPDDPERYLLSTLLQRFTQLQHLQLHVGHDWTADWPDAKHQALVEQFPQVRIDFVKGKTEFLQTKVDNDGDPLVNSIQSHIRSAFPARMRRQSISRLLSLRQFVSVEGNQI